MRTRRWLAWLGLMAVGAVLCTAMAAEQGGGKPGAPPPLVVDKNAPLLLEEPKAPPPKPKGIVADNTACFVCHTNYEEEELVLIHAKENVACVKCHGQSLDHRNDEDNITPPDKMYPLEKIDSACQECHEQHDAPAVKVLARWQERCPKKTDPKSIVCTDCHGMHRLTRRTVQWDKRTGKLMSQTSQAKAAAGK